MTETYSPSSSRGSRLSAHALRQQKKKALQSYKKIDTIKKIAESDTTAAAREADMALDTFIRKT